MPLLRRRTSPCWTIPLTHRLTGDPSAAAALWVLTALLWSPPAAASEVPFGPVTPVGTHTGLYLTAVDVADVDGDGHPDPVASSIADLNLFIPGELAWYPNPAGDAGFGSAWTIPPGITFGVRATDVDDDGDADLMASDIATPAVVWWENSGDGSSFTQRTAASGFGTWVVDAADLDGDSDTDLVSAGSFIRWHESDGADPPAFTAHTLSSSDNWHDVVPADLDGDTDADVLAVTAGTPAFPPDPQQPIRVVWFENDGLSPPAFTAHGIGTLSPICPTERLNPPCMRIHAADVDGDGHLDVVVGRVGGDAFWYESDGGAPPGFTGHAVGTAAPATPVDLDGDGDLDVVSALNQLTWLENDGASPPGWTTHTLATLLDPPLSPARPGGVAAADFDADGDPDLLVGGGLELVWLENQRPPPAAIPTLGPAALTVLAALLLAAARAPSDSRRRCHRRRVPGLAAKKSDSALRAFSLRPRSDDHSSVTPPDTLLEWASLAQQRMAGRRG